MSAIATKTRLPRATIPPLAGILAPYFQQSALLPDESATPLDNGPILRLSQVSKATLFYESPTLSEMQFAGSGIVNEASALMAFHRDRWSYRGRSAYEIATALQERFYGGRTSGFLRGGDMFKRTPLKGWALLAATHDLGLVQWSCYAPTDDQHYEIVPLDEAIARLTAGDSR